MASMNAVHFFREVTRCGVTFTDSQRRAIVHGHGPMTVYAGPGSGKTTVITWRAAHLVKVIGSPPERIVIFTFTRRSAQELKNRLARLDRALGGVTAGTFHSLFLRWLLRYGGINPRIWSAGEQRAAMSQVLHQLRIATTPDNVNRYLQAISQLKNRGIGPAQMNVKEHSHTLIKSVYEAYEGMQTELKRWDYDDILLRFYHVLQTDRAFYEQVAAACSFVMVDEFQDTSLLQWLPIKGLCKSTGNVLVVGDDDQSIYGFRGAAPHILEAFKHAFPAAPDVVLEHNFRSTDEIIHLSGSLIRHNKKRKEKSFVGVRGSGAKVRFFFAADEWDEARRVAGRIRRITAGADTARSIAVLARTNRQLGPVVDALFERRIMFGIDDAHCNLYSDYHIQMVLTFLRAAWFEDRVSDAKQAWMHFLRLHGERLVLHQSTDVGSASTVSQWVSALKKADPSHLATEFVALLKHLRCCSAVSGVQSIRVLLLPLMRTGNRISNRQEAIALLDLLEDRAKRAADTRSWLQDIDRLSATLHNRTSDSEKGVIVTTFHGAKGLEFDEVFLIGLHALALPHARVIEEAPRNRLTEAMEEERRLFYVGITRAKARLHLSCPRLAQRESCQPSSFLTDLGYALSPSAHSSTSPAGRSGRVMKLAFCDPKASLMSAPVLGSSWMHKIFGSGVVVSIDLMEDKAHKVGIMFNERDMRYLHWETAVQYGHVLKDHRKPKETES